MAQLMLDKARGLLRSAMLLYESGSLEGAVGLAYQAFEAAAIHLTETVNGKEPGTHTGRRKRAEELLEAQKMRFRGLWLKRNIDFYGTAEPGGEWMNLDEEDVHEVFEIVKGTIEEVDRFLSSRE